ncbi:hypothetical protein PN294_13585 [Romboutsia sp. 1001216sp1]|uniref:hypothetical protein n=1 Tax=unclassified Romboutsia TaxID=2626894 RepID=UPI00189DF687|nr:MULTISPECIES: hypothetical protein [unclassified Romboutsia]MDB8803216.1 hypothetical protein [Romboutsia sp. 1001216sp1]MDB8814575.1 hypothetical protein [Romboutsia sp. 1001216sp1]
MKKIILYVKNGKEYEVYKFENLGEGQKAFTERRKKKFDYLELGIDDLDREGGRYEIVRSIRL